MIDPLALPDLLQNHRLFMEEVLRDQHGNGLPDGLRRRVPINPLRCPVPGLDDARHVFTDNGIVRGFDNGRHMGQIMEFGWIWLLGGSGL